MAKRFGRNQRRRVSEELSAAGARFDQMVAEKKAEQHQPTAEDIESQDWAQVDGATAWHLVYRHAEDWAHTARLMHAWRDAAVAAAVAAEREAIRARGQHG